MTDPPGASGGAHSALAYRPGVGIMLLNSQRHVLVGQRIDNPSDAWQMPQGGIEPGETPADAAMRELKEEIGTNQAEIVAESREWLVYDLPEELVPVLWGGRYWGQRQKWFAMRFLGQDADIDLETDRPEFSNWKWLEPQALPGVIVPFKQRLYRRLLTEFAHCIEKSEG